ncbi:hypothetical protein HDU89_003832, partial [Geranomyces variabilis]
VFSGGKRAVTIPNERALCNAKFEACFLQSRTDLEEVLFTGRHAFEINIINRHFCIVVVLTNRLVE